MWASLLDRLTLNRTLSRVFSVCLPLCQMIQPHHPLDGTFQKQLYQKCLPIVKWDSSKVCLMWIMSHSNFSLAIQILWKCWSIPKIKHLCTKISLSKLTWSYLHKRYLALVSGTQTLHWLKVLGLCGTMGNNKE